MDIGKYSNFSMGQMALISSSNKLLPFLKSFHIQVFSFPVCINKKKGRGTHLMLSFVHIRYDDIYCKECIC